MTGRCHSGPSRPSATAARAASFFNEQNHPDRGDGKQASKSKKFLKPSKEGTKFICSVTPCVYLFSHLLSAF